MDPRYSLRRADQRDSVAIRRLIHQAQINPTGLDWRRFLVAVDQAGRLVACGQLKPHGGGIVELASIAVEDDHRRRGLARSIIEALLGEGPRPLYLTCREALGPLYAKWGFVELTTAEMPPYYRRLSGAMSLIMRAAGRGDRLLVMRLM